MFSKNPYLCVRFNNNYRKKQYMSVNLPNKIRKIVCIHHWHSKRCLVNFVEMTLTKIICLFLKSLLFYKSFHCCYRSFYGRFNCFESLLLYVRYFNVIRYLIGVCFVFKKLKRIFHGHFCKKNSEFC